MALTGSWKETGLDSPSLPELLTLWLLPASLCSSPFSATWAAGRSDEWG